MRFIIHTKKIDPRYKEDQGPQRRVSLALHFPTKTVAAIKRLLRDRYWLTYSNYMFRVVTQFRITNLGYIGGDTTPIVGTNDFEEDLELSIFNSIMDHFTELSLDGSLHDFKEFVSSSMILFRQYPMSLEDWYNRLIQIDAFVGRPLVMNKNNDLNLQISLTDFLTENRDYILAGDFANIQVNNLYYNPIVMHFDNQYDDLPLTIKVFSAIAARMNISVVYLKKDVDLHRSLFDIHHPTDLRIVRHDDNNGKLMFLI